MRLFRTQPAEVTLHIKGDLEVLRLQPGDTVVCTLDRKVPLEHAEHLKKQLAARFPNHNTLVVDNGLRLSTQREETP